MWDPILVTQSVSFNSTARRQAIKYCFIGVLKHTKNRNETLIHRVWMDCLLVLSTLVLYEHLSKTELSTFIPLDGNPSR